MRASRSSTVSSQEFFLVSSAAGMARLISSSGSTPWNCDAMLFAAMAVRRVIARVISEERF